MNNFKELGLAATQYVTDNKDWYFNTWNGGVGASYGKSDGGWAIGTPRTSTGYRGLLATYLGHDSSAYIGALFLDGKGKMYRSKLACPSLGDLSLNKGESHFSLLFTSFLGSNAVRLARVVRPARTALFAEVSHTVLNGFYYSIENEASGRAAVVTRHSRAGNVTFFDGHVKSIANAAIPYSTRSASGTYNYRNCFWRAWPEADTSTARADFYRF